MRIAVNAGSFSKNNLTLFLKFANAYVDENFIFLFNKEHFSYTFPSNVKPLVISSKTAFPLKRNPWYILRIKKTLKKEKADIFISEKSILIKSTIPQILLSPQLSYLFYPAGLEKKPVHFYQKNNKIFFMKADAIIVNSFFMKKNIIEKFQLDEGKIKVVYPESESFFKKPSYEEREKIKEKYTGGNEYFVYNGAIGGNENLLNLLKAFSFFKKRQRSKMQLLLAGSAGVKYEVFLESLRLFRFKNDVRIMTDISALESEKILSCAYAMVYVPIFKSQPIEVVDALKCEVPLIVSSTPILKEYCGEAALFADPADFKNIAEQMMSLFKDEQKRKELIEKGKLELKKFAAEKPEIILWKIIRNIVENT